MTKAERFAVLSWARDVAAGLIDSPSFEKDMKDAHYLDEAAEYMTKPEKDWPCGVLILMDKHTELHPECPKDQDWRE
jgi:hypothetical protein